MREGSPLAEPTGQQYVPALRKGLELLELLAEQGPLTLAQVERESGLNRTMSYRLLRVMAEMGYIEHDPVRHHYRLGARLLSLGAAVADRMRFAEVARPLLDAVREETRETVSLGMLSGNEVVYVGLLEGPRRSTLSAALGGRDHAHSTSLGKAILAYLPHDTRSLKVASLTPLPSLTPRTIVDAALLERELERTRKRGYALEDEENVVGARGVSVPVLDAQGHSFAALGLAGPVDRIDLERAERTAARLWQASRELSRRLNQSSERIAS